MDKIILILIFLGVKASYAQDQYPAYSYDYDLSGNRVKLTYVIYTPPDPEEVERGSGTSFNQNVKSYNEANFVKPENEDEGKEILPIKYEEPLGDRIITIYPNPTEGELKIEISNISNINQSQILISDLTGKILYNKEVISKITLFDMGSQSAGTYIMAVRINGKSSEWKIVKID